MRHGDSKRLEEAIDSVLQETLLLLRSGRGDAYRSYLAQLLAVWASGYLEAKCREVMFMYTERRANPGVARYVAKRLDQFRNPRADKILELMPGCSSERWKRCSWSDPVPVHLRRKMSS